MEPPKMRHKRVSSFMSHFSFGLKTPSPPSSSDSSPRNSPVSNSKVANFEHHQPELHRPLTPPSDSDYGMIISSPPRSNFCQHQRSRSRPLSMIQAYQPPAMNIDQDVIPELQPVFAFLNGQSNRLYHEGYFLKLDDQSTQGKPNPDRTWSECFAQLVGTVLSLWDAEELETAGEDGEVLPKFINLTDASIKMIEALPTKAADETPLTNILSISTAGRNRYLLHFNSHDSLLGWTGAIRLAMFEHAALQEAYTGALIAGKGKLLNNINIIMERSRFRTEVWARVRFGAGVPWRRCFCVITPPDEKEYAKLQKELKRRSIYDRSPIPALKGDIKFFDAKVDGKKLKKAKPIASITDAYSAYAVYPQSKSLVDASTLIKIEGDISIHTPPGSSSEGLVFIMPETRPAISGFETMMQFLFPTWDTFGLYGRPGKLVASVLDSRSLMFAMPKHREYSYLELQDITALLQSDGHTHHSEREWRRRLKKATGEKLNSADEGVLTHSHASSASRTSARSSVGPKVGFAGDGESPQLRHPGSSSESSSPDHSNSVNSVSANNGQSKLSIPNRDRGASVSSEDGRLFIPSPVEAMMPSHTPEPVIRPPAFNHNSEDLPFNRPYHSSEMRQRSSRLSKNTLAQMLRAGGVNESSGFDYESIAADAVRNGPAVPPHTSPVKQYSGENRSRPPSSHSNPRPPSNHSMNRPSSNHSAARPLSSNIPHRPSSHSAQHSESAFNYQSPQDSEGSRSPYSLEEPISEFQRQAPPSPRPLPNIPPQNEFVRPAYDDGPYPSPLQLQEHSSRGVFPMLGAKESKYKSLTPDDIVDHYTSQTRDLYDRETADALRSLPPIPPQHQHWAGFGEHVRTTGQPEYPARDVERPRTGVLKTVGGVDESSESDYEIPHFDFGPTFNYGSPTFKNVRSAAPAPRARPPKGHERQESQSRTQVPWRPPSSPPQQRTPPSSSSGHRRQRSDFQMSPATGRSPSPPRHNNGSVSP